MATVNTATQGHQKFVEMFIQRGNMSYCDHICYIDTHESSDAAYGSTMGIESLVIFVLR